MALNISKGKKTMPFLGTLYGSDGSGKTTLAASAPNPIVLDLEGGSAELDVDRVEGITSLAELIKTVDALAKDPQGYQTIVVDSLSTVEPWIWSLFTDPGYGKGPEIALTHWRSLTAALDRARSAGFNIILIAHAWPAPANDPTQVTPYDKMGLRLDKKAAAYIREYSYAVFYLTREVIVAKDNKQDKKGKAFDSGADKRLIYTVGRPAFDAKSRYELPSEIELVRPNGWAHIFGASVDYDKELATLIPQIKDEAIRDKAQEHAKNKTINPAALLKKVRDQLEAEKRGI